MHVLVHVLVLVLGRISINIETKMIEWILLDMSIGRVGGGCGVGGVAEVRGELECVASGCGAGGCAAELLELGVAGALCGGLRDARPGGGTREQ